MQTLDFGPLTFEDKDVITFPMGLVAFEHLHRYVLLEAEENSPWRTLQSVEDGIVSFAVVDPWAVASHYDPLIAWEALGFTGLRSSEEAAFLVIAVVPEEIRQTTVNLRAPIVINPQTRVAWQVILAGDEYPIRFPVFETEGAGGPLGEEEPRVVVERRNLQVEAILVP